MAGKLPVTRQMLLTHVPQAFSLNAFWVALPVSDNVGDDFFRNNLQICSIFRGTKDKNILNFLNILKSIVFYMKRVRIKVNTSKS